MASKTGKPVSQADYLKKYLSGGAEETKKTKKKKVKAKPVQAFKIVDADEQARAQEIKIVDIEDGMLLYNIITF